MPPNVRGMMTFTEPVSAPSVPHASLTDRLRLAVAAYLAHVRICRVQLVGAMVNTWPPGIMK